jgi:hypothetical protein
VAPPAPVAPPAVDRDAEPLWPEEPPWPPVAAVPNRIGLIGVFVAVAAMVALFVVRDSLAAAVGVVVVSGISVAIGGFGCGSVLYSAYRARVRPHWLRWAVASALVGFTALGVGLVLLLFEPTRVAGVLLMCVAPGLIFGGRWTVRSVDRNLPVAPRTDLRRLLVIAALLPVALLGMAGQAVRFKVDYVGRYGTPVVASPGFECVTTFKVNGPGGGWVSTKCPSSSYTIDGVNHLAELHLGRDESVAFRSDRVPADALGNRLVSRRLVGRIDPVTVLGHYLPPWLLLATAAEAALIALRLRSVRRARRDTVAT